MKLSLSGNWSEYSHILLGLLKAGFHLEWVTESDAHPSENLLLDTVLLCLVCSTDDLPAHLKGWYAIDATPDNRLTLPAFQHGAAAVFPASLPVDNLVAALTNILSIKRTNQPVNRQFSSGSIILLESDQVMKVEQGIVASFVIHKDGKQTLVGMWSSGDLILAHPSDDCHLEMKACSTVQAKIYAWPQIINQTSVLESLRRRLYLTEAWASVQARPYLEDRLSGILHLLAEQFGQPHPDGTLITLRLTHHLLASAIGANRTTVTRILSNFKRTGRLKTTGLGKQERFILTEPVPLHHR